MENDFNISGDISSQQFTNGSTSSSGSVMVDFLINHNIVKDPKTANIVLTIGSLILIGVSIYLFKYGF